LETEKQSVGLLVFSNKDKYYYLEFSREGTSFNRRDGSDWEQLAKDETRLEEKQWYSVVVLLKENSV
jgi:hypothetical protein